MSDDPFKFVFPIIRRPVIPDPYAGERCVNQPGICMRQGCGQKRWAHPYKGELVLCEDHAEEVFRGEAKGPPLRRGIDYQFVARPTFLVEFIPEDKKKL